MLKSAWTKMTRSSTPDERKYAFIGWVLIVCTLWLYFRMAHLLPVVVDMLFPVWWGAALLLIMFAIRRTLGLEVRLWTDDTAGQPEPYCRLSSINRHGLFTSIMAISTGFWIAMDHTERFPDGWAVVLIVLGVLGAVLVPCVNAAVHVIRSKVAP